MNILKKFAIFILGLATLAFPVLSASGQSDNPSNIKASPFAQNVTRHVVMHEVAHALIREFDLPILGNEEDIADHFATIMLVQFMPDRAEEIVKDRARSWLFEAKQSAFSENQLKGEHQLDARRAYRAACILFGLNPKQYDGIARWVELSDNDAAGCADAAPEIERSWRRILADKMMPSDQLSNEFRLIYGEGPMKASMQQSGFLPEMAEIIRRFDWHSQITLHFDHCDVGAQWQRNGRRILLCDDYVARFVTQGRALEN